MSLINQMLQDLDARHSDLSAGGAIRGEVRAAPERDGIHPAWWLALVLALLLAGGATWLWRRQSPPALNVVTPSAAPQMPAARPAPGVSTAKSTGASDPAPQVIAVPPAGSVNQPVSAGPPTVSAAPPAVSAAPPAVVAAPPAAAATTSNASIAPNMQLRLDKQFTEPAPVARRERATAPAATAMPSAAPKTKVAEGRPAASRAPARSSEPGKPPDINKQVKELSPQQRAENEYRKAISLMQEGRVTESIDGLGQALQLDRHHAAARQTLVELLLGSKRQDEAISRLQEGLGLDPNQPGLAMILARLQVEKGDIRPAVDTLRRTLPHAADRADYHAFLAALLQREGRHKDAVEHYGLALRKSPQNGVWWMGLGISLRAENRLPEARDAFGRAKSSNTLTSELLAFVEQQLKQLR